jgi:NMD protein affecting ribosome stability and mRNA decay
MFERIPDCGGTTLHEVFSVCPICYREHPAHYRLKNSTRICPGCANDIKRDGERFKKEHWTNEQLDAAGLPLLP